MLRYLVRRILWAILVFVAITFVTFVIFFMAPNDPARTVCGGSQASPQCIALATERLGLDQPIPVQYYRFIRHLVVDRSLGNSMAQGNRVNDAILQAAPVTGSLVFGGAVLWMMIGLSVGIYSTIFTAAPLAILAEERWPLAPRSARPRTADPYADVPVAGKESGPA